MSDSAGNTYVRALGPTTGIGSWLMNYNQEVWYAAGVTGGSGFSVTAAFSGAINSDGGLSCNEYSGVTPANPLDQASASVGSSVNAVSNPLTTGSANELIYAAATFYSAGAVGPGFIQRSSLTGNLTEDAVVGPPGSYSALFTNAAMDWTVQVISFKGN
jgi:hypothetical protein